MRSTRPYTCCAACRATAIVGLLALAGASWTQDLLEAAPDTHGAAEQLSAVEEMLSALAERNPSSEVPEGFDDLAASVAEGGGQGILSVTQEQTILTGANRLPVQLVVERLGRLLALRLPEELVNLQLVFKASEAATFTGTLVAETPKEFLRKLAAFASPALDLKGTGTSDDPYILSDSRASDGSGRPEAIDLTTGADAEWAGQLFLAESCYHLVGATGVPVQVVVEKLTQGLAQRLPDVFAQEGRVVLNSWAYPYFSGSIVAQSVREFLVSLALGATPRQRITGSGTAGDPYVIGERGGHEWDLEVIPLSPPTKPQHVLSAMPTYLKGWFVTVPDRSRLYCRTLSRAELPNAAKGGEITSDWGAAEGPGGTIVAWGSKEHIARVRNAVRRINVTAPQVRVEAVVYELAKVRRDQRSRVADTLATVASLTDVTASARIEWEKAEQHYRGMVEGLMATEETLRDTDRLIKMAEGAKSILIRPELVEYAAASQKSVEKALGECASLVATIDRVGALALPDLWQEGEEHEQTPGLLARLDAALQTLDMAPRTDDPLMAARAEQMAQAIAQRSRNIKSRLDELDDQLGSTYGFGIELPAVDLQSPLLAGAMAQMGVSSQFGLRTLQSAASELCKAVQQAETLGAEELRKRADAALEAHARARQAVEAPVRALRAVSDDLGELLDGIDQEMLRLAIYAIERPQESWIGPAAQRTARPSITVLASQTYQTSDDWPTVSATVQATDHVDRDSLLKFLWDLAAKNAEDALPGSLIENLAGQMPSERPPIGDEYTELAALTDGITLRVDPRATDQYATAVLNLKITPSATDPRGAAQRTPLVASGEVSTVVRVRSSQAFVLSSLTATRTTVRREKHPLFRDIPIIRHWFTRKTGVRHETHVVALVQAVVIPDETQRLLNVLPAQVALPVTEIDLSSDTVRSFRDGVAVLQQSEDAKAFGTRAIW